LPTTFYIRTMKAENNELKKQLNLILEHEASLWEKNMELENSLKNITQHHETLLKQSEDLQTSVKNLEHKLISVMETNVKLEHKHNTLASSNAHLLSEIEDYRESTKSLEQKSYVMNSHMDNLLTVCNNLFSNMEQLFQNNQVIASLASYNNDIDSQKSRVSRILSDLQTPTDMFEWVGDYTSSVHSFLGKDGKTEDVSLVHHIFGKEIRALSQKLLACENASRNLCKYTRITQ